MSDRQQMLEFPPDREADRAERLRRVAELAASSSTTTAKHLFDAQGEREARRIAGESVPHPGAGSASTR